LPVLLFHHIQPTLYYRYDKIQTFRPSDLPNIDDANKDMAYLNAYEAPKGEIRKSM
jgi:hypothetical protein